VARPDAATVVQHPALVVGMPVHSRLPPNAFQRGRRNALRILGAVMAALVLAPSPARADVVPVKAAELRIDEGDLLLSAEFDLALTPTLEEALQKGIPLYFAIEFDLTHARWYWVDEKVAEWSITYRVSYSALTRQYRVASGPLGQTFGSLDDVERFIGRVSPRPVARADALVKGERYDAALRLRLDVTQLPKPFQVNALALREWQLASDWHRWSFTP
jgi:hypothetical protein